MYIQPHFSQLMPLRGRAWVLGNSMLTLIGLPSKYVREVGGGETKHRQRPQRQNDVEHRLVVSGANVPKVDEDNPQAVIGVEDDRSHQADFGDTHKRRLVGVDNDVVGLGAHPDERGVENVYEEEEVDPHTGNAVQYPRPHSFATPIQGPPGNNGLLFWGRNVDVSCC